MNPFELSKAEQIGLMANLATFEAQDRISSGNYDDTNHEQVYNLFACAYDETAAEKARSTALERLVKQSCDNATKK